MNAEKVEELLASVGKEQRAEVLEKLKEAHEQGKGQQELQALVRQYERTEDTEEPAWLQDSYELSDEDLAMVAGGAEMPWDSEVDDTCCN